MNLVKTTHVGDQLPSIESQAVRGEQATRARLLVMQLDGYDDETVGIDFHVQGFVLTTEGATVVLSVNGQTTFADFPAN